MPPSISIADLIDTIADVRLTCLKCGRSVVLPGRQVLLRFGPAFPVRDLGRRHRCSACGSREIDSRPQYYGAPTEPISRHTE